MTPDQARQVIQAAQHDSLEALWVLAITAGLRQGELLALRWADIDLDHGRLSVVATLEQRRRHTPRLTSPKMKRGRRQVLLSEAAADAYRPGRPTGAARRAW